MNDGWSAPVERALEQSARTYGVKKLAADLARSEQSLRNKLCLSNQTHHLTLREALQLMRLAGNEHVLEAMCSLFGGSYLPRIQCAEAPKLMGDLAKMSAAFAELMREVADDLADGIITSNELKKIEKEAADLRQALGTVVADLRALQQQQQPVPLSA